MRGSVLAMLFSVMCVSVSAEEAKQPSPLGSDDLWIRQSACKGVGDIAVTVMTQRQKQVPMSEMISRLQLAEGMGIYEGTGGDNQPQPIDHQRGVQVSSFHKARPTK